MEEVPTAEDFLKKHEWTGYYAEMLREFAKLHVKAALKLANENVNYQIEEFGGVMPNSVLNVYPENLIK